MGSTDGRPDARPAQILIVDDRPANLLALELVLEPLGRQVVSARSGQEALRRVLEADFSVILMDVAMPELDGMETASLIRERERSRCVPIIFVTAQPAEVEQVRHAYALGGIDYVIKPFDPLIMRSKVGAFVQLYEQAQALQDHAQSLTAETGRRIQAEHAVRSKDLSISILGHDLRNPLAVMQTGVEMLLARAPEADRTLLGRMARSVQRMDRLVGNILEFARATVETDLNVVCDPGELESTVRDLIDELRLAHPDRGLDLEVQGSTACAYDATRMGQVVANLIGNAIQHSAAGAIHVLVDGSDAEHVRLMIRNMGTIPADILPHLFEPFRRADARTDGLGLGLYIVHEIARAHRGTVEVHVDREREITTFSFTLPRHPPARLATLPPT